MKKYVAEYLLKTTEIAKRHFAKEIVTLQFFQRDDNVKIAGMEEVLRLLREHSRCADYEIRYRPEGDVVNANDIVLELRGPYASFGFLEGIIDGILDRQCSIATNAYRLVQAAPNKKFVFMGDRADHYRNQQGDGYAAAVGGIKTQVTEAQVSEHSGQSVGTMPHALIAIANGDLVRALEAYAETYPGAPLVGLVDFKDDVVADSLAALKAFGKKLTAVRVDTSSSVSDKMFAGRKSQPRGVVPEQIKRLRRALDKNNGRHVEIIVSSGFTAAKVSKFEKAKAPVDTYGVGEYVLKVWVNFTADITQVSGQNIAKFGRGYRPIQNYRVLKQD